MSICNYILFLYFKDESELRKLEGCIGLVDHITIAPDRQEDLSTCKKIHFRNNLRPCPLLIVKHWNEQMRMEMKVRAKITISQTLYKLKDAETSRLLIQLFMSVAFIAY